MAKKLTQEAILLQFKEKHGDRYDYSLVEYKNNRTKLDIICAEHGVFEQTSKNHGAKGYGCPKCGAKRKLRYTHEEIISKFKAKHGELYDYSLVVYNGTHTNVDIICRKHGVFSQWPLNHFRRGDGCKKCANEKSIAYHMRDSYIGKPTILYYVKITSLLTSNIVYKIGLTQSTVISRFKREKSVKVEVITEELFTHGEEAYEKEQSILVEYSDALYWGERILENGGNTELFGVDIFKTS